MTAADPIASTERFVWTAAEATTAPLVRGTVECSTTDETTSAVLDTGTVVRNNADATTLAYDVGTVARIAAPKLELPSALLLMTSSGISPARG
jgi:hypothetical protein